MSEAKRAHLRIMESRALPVRTHEQRFDRTGRWARGPGFAAKSIPVFTKQKPKR